MEQFDFDVQDRLQILNLLPQDVGSLRESIQVKRVRDKIKFTDSERAALDFDPENGSFDPSKMDEVGTIEVELGQNARNIIAGSIIRLEDGGSVPTNDTFVDLALLLEDDIKDFRESLDE